ncbi:hypothetical protein DC28_04470 [Spirochaeta lutea]|uniref:Leucine-binding protein domain-containing protein n=1 Tax=Spirochaeta lutea TaxID=1480694 RepID=A0A098R126_9SPIO|nr:hypothetical protein DC28_04470 [Spirochaeta lutea]
MRNPGPWTTPVRVTPARSSKIPHLYPGLNSGYPFIHEDNAPGIIANHRDRGFTEPGAPLKHGSRKTAAPGVLLLFAIILLTGCASKPIRLGFIGSLTGPISTHGIVSREAVVLAVEEQNLAGGINGRQIELIIRDDKNDPDTAKAALHDLVDQGVVAVIGPQTSAMSAALLPLLDEISIPVISPSTSSDYFAGQDDYFYTLVSRVSFETRHLAWHLSLTNPTPIRASLILDRSNNTYTENWARTLGQNIRDFGGTILTEMSFHAEQDPAFGRLAEELLRQNPDTVAIAAGALQAALIAQQLRLSGFTGRLVINGWAKTPDFINFGGDAVQGALFSERFNSSDSSPAYLDFRSAFIHRFDHAPDFQSVHSYEATQLLFFALSQLPQGNESGSDPEALKAALDAVPEFQGLQGPIRFQTGDAMRSLYLQEVRGQRYVPLGESWNPPDVITTPAP